MKKFIISIMLGTCFFSAVFAQNKIIKDPNAETRSVHGFHVINVSSGIHLYLSQGNEEAVAVSASERKYRDRIRTEVDNGVLKIYYEKENGLSWDTDDDKKKLKAYVSCIMLDRLKGSSGAEVEVDGTLKSTHFAMDFSSGSNFQGRVNVSDLKVQENSGAETKIGGTAASVRIEASSGSTLNGYELETDLCDANTSSGASVSITVRKGLSASASSGSQINYKGSGVIKDSNTSSGGEVSKR